MENLTRFKIATLRRSVKLNVFSHRLVELGGVAGLLHTPYGPPRKTLEKLVSGERGQENEGGGGWRTFSTSLSCQGSVLLMHVRLFESAQLLCLDSLYPPLSLRKECIQGLFVELRLVTRSDSDRDLI